MLRHHHPAMDTRTKPSRWRKDMGVEPTRRALRISPELKSGRPTGDDVHPLQQQTQPATRKRCSRTKRVTPARSRYSST